MNVQYVLAKAKHINLVTPINEVTVFHLRELLANVDGLPAAILTKSVIDALCTSIKPHILLTPFTRSHRTLCTHLTDLYTIRYSLYYYLLLVLFRMLKSNINQLEIKLILKSCIKFQEL